MQDHNQPLEMHIHGDVPCRIGITQHEIEAALAPLLAYTKRHFAKQGGLSLYDEEPGIQFSEPDHVLHFCWSVAGDVDFRETLDELVMGLNDISREGATLEVSFYDLEFDDDDEWDEPTEGDASEPSNPDAEEEEDDSRDDFFVLFIGPTPAAIMQVQRDLLVRDVTTLMERHFDKEELTPVIEVIDKMWEGRFKALISSLKFPSYAKGNANNLGGNGGNGSHGFGAHGAGGGRKSRHSH
ncbi:MAG: hypothetical protein QM533_08615 [Cytophagales bacterium]|nr:hypothetical protein [Cytophagales bacterium]